jgi:hypothetical protein
MADSPYFRILESRCSAQCAIDVALRFDTSVALLLVQREDSRIGFSVRATPA